MEPTPAFVNWSGGKDAAHSLYCAREAFPEIEVGTLLTTANRTTGRTGLQGMRAKLVEAQAEAMGLDLRFLWLSGEITTYEYAERMVETVEALRDEGFGCAVFGDIYLDGLRSFREERLSEVGLDAVFPLWEEATDRVARRFLDTGFRAVVVCVDADRLGPEYAGREFDRDFLDGLPDDVDPCGENGEFHTCVYDGPIFDEPVGFARGELVYRTYPPDAEETDRSSDADAPSEVAGFWYRDLLPEIG